MPQLIRPLLSVAPSVRAAAREFGDDGLTAYTRAVRDLPDGDLGGYVAALLAEVHEDTPRPEGLVPATHLWWVDGETFLGRVHIRHRLTPDLFEVNGHLGYHVVPTHRRRGHATAMLQAALPFAKAIGIAQLLVTCDATNEASHRVIEAAGGELEDQRGEKLRFWIDLTH
jgi:predicted acetyltransferase